MNVLAASYLPQIRKIFEGKPIRKAYLFGSAVRSDFNEKSDLDLLIELDTTQLIGLIEYVKWHQEIEAALNRKIDLVPADGVSPHIKSFIDAEKVLIYEA